MAIQNKIYVRQSSDFQVDGFWFVLESVLLIGVNIYHHQFMPSWLPFTSMAFNWSRSVSNTITTQKIVSRCHLTLLLIIIMILLLILP